MKKNIFVFVFFCSFVSIGFAQWGGALDPALIRQAGQNASSGNLEIGNIRINGRDPRYPSPDSAPAPSAEQIAYEIRRQDGKRSTAPHC